MRFWAQKSIEYIQIDPKLAWYAQWGLMVYFLWTTSKNDPDFRSALQIWSTLTIQTLKLIHTIDPHFKCDPHQWSRLPKVIRTHDPHFSKWSTLSIHTSNLIYTFDLDFANDPDFRSRLRKRSRLLMQTSEAIQTSDLDLWLMIAKNDSLRWVIKSDVFFGSNGWWSREIFGRTQYLGILQLICK